MNHDTLGPLDQSDSHPFDAAATIEYRATGIRVGIIRDDQALETTLNLAADVVSRLAELDQLAKQIASADLRETYNNGWNEYDEAQEDGSFKMVSKPQLSGVEFEAKLSLTAINVTGDRVVEFFYDDEQMFWGHCIVVTSFKGTDFSEASAAIAG